MPMSATQRGEDAGERRERYGNNCDCVKLNEMVHVYPFVLVMGLRYSRLTGC